MFHCYAVGLIDIASFNIAFVFSLLMLNYFNVLLFDVAFFGVALFIVALHTVALSNVALCKSCTILCYAI